MATGARRSSLPQQDRLRIIQIIQQDGEHL